MTRINWSRIWWDFDVWYKEKERKLRCDKCGALTLDEIEWDDQREKIKELVEKARRKDKG